MREFHIKIPGFNIAAKAWGNETGKPVLCLHGKLDNAASFDYLAPLMPDFHLIAIDFPGTGYSSHYPLGVVPSWRNDTFLLFQIAETLNWKQFDIVAHSLGSLSATAVAISRRKIVRRMVFLDVLGPTLNFIENRNEYFNHDVDCFLGNEMHKATIFPTEESAILDRMKIGNISYQAAQALVKRGTQKTEAGIMWTFDRRLRCLSSTLPFEDELQSMFHGIDIPVCLIRAEQGVTYPKATFLERCQAIRDLKLHSLAGGHHVHMDEPNQVAAIASRFLLSVE